MTLWTIQPEAIWHLLEKEGTYRCDPSYSSMPEYRKAYDWLCAEMAARIGPPPLEVTCPVWAWYQQDGLHKRPDLRRERWCYGKRNEPYVCIEAEIPEKDVLLSDFDAWHFILLNELLSDTEDEDREQETFYKALSESARNAYKHDNWKWVFNISPLKMTGSAVVNGFRPRSGNCEWIRAKTSGILLPEGTNEGGHRIAIRREAEQTG